MPGGSRFGRGDRNFRAVVGVGLVTLGAVISYPTWAATVPKHRWDLFSGIGFDLGLVAGIAGLLLLGSTLPALWQPRFRITCGNGPQFDRPTAAKPAERAVLPEIANVEVHDKVLKVEETRGRWADRVTVEVISVVPPHPHDQREFLPWWGTETYQEFATFVPGRARWVVFHKSIKEAGGDTGRSNPLSAEDEADVRLAVVWDGKVLSAIDVHAKGLKTEVYPTVEKIGTPSLRSVRRQIKQRDR